MPRDSNVLSRRAALKTASALGITGVAGCLGGDDDSITIYTNLEADGVFQAFEDETGIEVNDELYTGPEVSAQFLTDQETGEYNVDVIISATTGLTQEPMAQWLEPVEVPNADDILTEQTEQLLRDFGTLEGDTAPVWTFHWFNRSIIYNTDLVDEPPTTYDEVLEERFENEIVKADFLYGFHYQHLRMMGWEDERIEEYLATLHDHVFEHHSNAPQTQMVSGGQAMLGFMTYDAFAAPSIEEGAPIDMVFPPFITQHGTAVGRPTEAPNPSGAEEFIEWICSREGQETVAEEEQSGVAHVDIPHGSDIVQERLDEYDPERVPLLMTIEREEELTSRVEELGLM